MKRILSALLALVCLFSLCACTAYQESPEPLYTQTYTGDEKIQINCVVTNGVTYLVYSDGTASVSAIDPDLDSYGDFTIIDTVRERYPVTAIEAGAFAGTHFGTVTMPATVTAIGKGAFEGAAIRSVVLPDSLTELGEEAFYNCVKLRSISFSTALTAVPRGCFYGCTALQEISLPDSVFSIGEEAFAACTALQSFRFPQALESIGQYAFYQSGTDELQFEIPAFCRAIGAAAFAETSWLRAQTAQFVLVGDGVLLRYNGIDSALTLPDSVKYICDAFNGSSVRSLTVPDSVTGICSEAFAASGILEFSYNPQNALLAELLS